MLAGKKLALCAFMCSLMPTFIAHAAEPGKAQRVAIEAFARSNPMSAPQLSPDGLHMAVSADLGKGNHALVIYRLADMQQTALLRLPRYQLTGSMRWVSNQRLVIAKAKQFGGREAPYMTGEIIATDVDGRNQDYVFGWERSLRTQGIEPGFGYIAGTPLQPNGHFYMSRYSAGASRSQLYDIDTERATSRLMADVPAKDLSFLMDDQGVPRYAFGVDDNDRRLLFVADVQGKNWQPITSGQTGGPLRPLAFTADGQRLFARYAQQGGPWKVITSDLQGQQRQVVLEDAFSSVDELEWSAAPYRPIGGSLAAGKPRMTYFDPSSADASKHESIANAIPGKYISYTGHSLDGNTSLLFANSDRDPGTWYLLDKAKGTLEPVLTHREGIDPERMGERRPFRFKASDGTELDGFLTLPAGVESPAKLPMVLLPHGGPHAVFDGWAYDNDAQFLASRGYLVLQVNFRGSGNRGDRFGQAGFRQWGTRVQDDLLDGVRWTIAQGYADPQRICAFGASFGAYSAMMVAARDSSLFQCVAGLAGLYDLPMMYAKGDIRTSRSGQNYLARAVGTDPADLKSNSPTTLAAQIKVPVFLAHGEADERTPFAQAKAMKAALEAAGNAPEWMAVAKEGHGFYDDDNNIAFFQRLEAFLDRHIGSRVDQ